MTPRAGRPGWVGLALAVAAGLALSAPRAAADCASRLPLFGIPTLPFPVGPQRPQTPHHTDAPKRSEPNRPPAPCNGPNCRKVPSDPTPPTPVPPPSPHGEQWAWTDGSRTPLGGNRAAWVCGETLLFPFFSPSPPEPPPR